MKFNVGDTIKMCKPSLRMGKNHLGMIGKVFEIRYYSRKLSNNQPTHYVVEFEKYKIPHIYMISDIDECCELIKKGE